MELEYRKVGDHYLPNLVAPENMKNFKIGKYGNLRLRYLKEHKKTNVFAKEENKKLYYYPKYREDMLFNRRRGNNRKYRRRKKQ